MSAEAGASMGILATLLVSLLAGLCCIAVPVIVILVIVMTNKKKKAQQEAANAPIEVKAEYPDEPQQ